MATGRSVPDFQDIYISGYDMTCYAMDSGEIGVEFPPAEGYTWCDPIKGALVGKPTVSFGPFVGVFDNTATSGLHVIQDAAKGSRQNITLIRGVRADGAMGDDAFCYPGLLKAYKSVGGGVVTARSDFVTDANSGLLYNVFWGKLLHVMGAETAANTANTNVDNGASSALGGWMMYHIRSITGSGTVTISIDDSANGTAWSALSGATSGAIATASAPTSGIVQLGVTATVRQYLRPQIAFGGSASACTFALAFVRGR